MDRSQEQVGSFGTYGSGFEIRGPDMIVVGHVKMELNWTRMLEVTGQSNAAQMMARMTEDKLKMVQTKMDRKLRKQVAKLGEKSPNAEQADCNLE